MYNPIERPDTISAFGIWETILKNKSSIKVSKWNSGNWSKLTKFESMREESLNL